MKVRRAFLLVLAASSPALLAADDRLPVRPGLWEVVNRPGVATLDGRTLDSLPLFKIEPERLCLDRAKAVEPATFLPGELRENCRITETRIEGSQIVVKGSCPSLDGGEDGTLLLKGKLEPERYSVDFETSAAGDNGLMTFSGTLSGRRLGECAG